MLTILPIVVPVAYGTDGPILDISVLKGEKTVLLDGSFDGLYVLYGSHDNSNFVPIFSFFGARPQSIKEIFSSSYLSIRMRSLASNAVGVGVSISGEFSASANSFAPLPIVNTGAYGPQAKVDLFTLVPPTGFLSGTNVILTGNFIGTVTVEGSLDGSRFSPVAVFKNLSVTSPNSGLQPIIAQNGPAVYTQQVRYLRVNVLEGTFVLGTLFTTVGGETEDTATSSTFLSEPVTNGAGTLLLAGEVVRISGNETVSRAKADVVGNVNGLVGVMLADTPAGSIEDVVNSGRGFILLEPGLTIAAGDQLYVSATFAGRATNVMPALQVPVGIIKDASPYALTGGVVADINPGFTVATSVPSTLHQSYGVGAVPLDQTLSLLDANGGSLIVDGTNVGFTGSYSVIVKGSSQVTDNLAVGVVTATARIHAAAGTATAGTSPLKIPSGVVLATPEPGAVEADNNHVYWTNSAGSRLQLDNSAVTTTLAQAYANGTVAADQTLSLLDSKGGGLIVDGTAIGFTGAYALAVKGSSQVTDNLAVGVATATARIHAAAGTATAGTSPLKIPSGVVLATPEPGAVEADNNHVYWTNSAGSRLQLDNSAVTTTLAQAYANGTVAADQTLSLLDSRGGGLVVDGTAVGFTGAYALDVLGNQHISQALAVNAGLVLGVGLTPPGESDLVMAAGATNVSTANTGRFGYLAGATQQFMVSMNTGAYVPLLVGPSVAGFTLGSVPFAGVTGQLTQDNANFFWDVTNKRLGVGIIPTATLHVVQQAINAAVPNAFILVGGAHTAITAGTEDVGANFNFSATKTWASGAIATQREVIFQAPTYAFTAASTITNAATVAITNSPQLGANAAFTNSYALWVQAGNSKFANNVGINTTIQASASLEVATVASISTTGNATNPGTVKITDNSVAGPSATGGLEFQADTAGNGLGAKICTHASNKQFIIARRSASNAWTNTVQIDLTTGNVGINTLFTGPASTSRLDIGNSSIHHITSATGAVWNSIWFEPTSVTIDGGVTPITSLSFFNVGAPTVSAASAVVITDFFTCRLASATFSGTGPASATRNWSLGVDGNTKFGGGQTIHGTDVNVAGPYAILATDYYLHVRRTAVAPISLNLPSIAVVGDGFVITAKDSGYNAAVNAITWVRNGADLIENVAGNYPQSVSGSSLTFVSNATTNNWELS